LYCDTKGFIHAVNLYDVLKQMKGSENIRTVDVNDCLLKEDFRRIGSEAVMKTFFEVNYLV